METRQVVVQWPPASGYAVALRGVVLAKTVSHCPRGAMVNGLALEFNLWANDTHTDEDVRAKWLEVVAKLPEYSLVECAVYVNGQLDPATVELRMGEAREPSPQGEGVWLA